MQVSVHVAPSARVAVQPDPAAPFDIGPDASQELPLHTAVSVRVPAVHDLVPERVYPVLQVGVHDEPSASVEVQPGPGAPFAIGPLGSHGTRAVHSFGGPAVDSVSSRRSKAASHALACVNMSPYTVNDAVFQPVMSWLNDQAPSNMYPMSVTCEVSHAEMSALN